jgi:hypothetical protein
LHGSSHSRRLHLLHWRHRRAAAAGVAAPLLRLVIAQVAAARTLHMSASSTMNRQAPTVTALPRAAATVNVDVPD